MTGPSPAHRHRHAASAKAAPPPQPQTVKSVSGKVVDSNTGEPIAERPVMLQDSRRPAVQTPPATAAATSASPARASNPIAPGRIDLGAGKDDIKATKSDQRERRAEPDRPADQPGDQGRGDPERHPVGERGGRADRRGDRRGHRAAHRGGRPPASRPPRNEDSGGFGSWLLILLGGLFVAVGVGTIVLLWMRRKNDDDGDGDGPVPVARRRCASRGARGAYRAPTTRPGWSTGSAPAGPDDGRRRRAERRADDDAPPGRRRRSAGPVRRPAQPYGAARVGSWAGRRTATARSPRRAGTAPGGYGNAPASGGGYGTRRPAAATAPCSGGRRLRQRTGLRCGYGARSGGGYGGRLRRRYRRYPPAPGAAAYGERTTSHRPATPATAPVRRPPADPYPTSTYQPADAGAGLRPARAGQYGRGRADRRPTAPGTAATAAPAGGYDSGRATVTTRPAGGS